MASGEVFYGHGAGMVGDALGEVCFNTAMTGYQEILTDPSYAGQIVTMTCPLIGNYGVNDGDMESLRAQPRGFVVRELSNTVSNYRATRELSDWLADQGVTGISGVDTRALTRILRTQGALKGVLSTDPDTADAELVEMAKRARGLVGVNLV
ncbi:MAG: carbamoyl-phosphate synthase small subunit, partial [Robiginitomaculum sp.]|nr:carbamoyl-phosphate synthase small subunit [Robiginitomaculum sp.]